MKFKKIFFGAIILVVLASSILFFNFDFSSSIIPGWKTTIYPAWIYILFFIILFSILSILIIITAKIVKKIYLQIYRKLKQ